MEVLTREYNTTEKTNKIQIEIIAETSKAESKVLQQIEGIMLFNRGDYKLKRIMVKRVDDES